MPASRGTLSVRSRHGCGRALQKGDFPSRVTAVFGRAEAEICGARSRFLIPEDKNAEQVARANDHGRHAACYRRNIEMKPRAENRNAAHGAPAMVVAHL